MEFVIDSAMNIWLIGSQGIHFYDSDGEINPKIDKEALSIPHTNFKKHFYCPGAYCKFENDINYFEDGDEAAEAYVKIKYIWIIFCRKKKKLTRLLYLKFNLR